MRILRVTPQTPPYRQIPITPLKPGRTVFTSIDCPAACFRLHFRSRSIPCLGPGCPICPLPARLTAVFTGKVEDSKQIEAIQLPCVGQIADLAATWTDGWKITISKSGKRTRLIEAVQALHIQCNAYTEKDLDESLARMWGLPSPSDYPSEEQWISAAFAVIGRRL